MKIKADLKIVIWLVHIMDTVYIVPSVEKSKQADEPCALNRRILLVRKNSCEFFIGWLSRENAKGIFKVIFSVKRQKKLVENYDGTFKLPLFG